MAVRLIRLFVLIFTVQWYAATPVQAAPQPKAKSVRAVADPCPRPPERSEIGNPPYMVSPGGTFYVSFSFQTRQDERGRQLYCFMTPNGLQNPTLYVNPGDTMVVTVTNNTPAGAPMMKLLPPNCGPAGDNTELTHSSVNLHYHGTNTSPACGSDEVIKTIINSGKSFTYTLTIPFDEPPGLYWYHPHIHMISDPIVMGGATGAIVVGGIESFQPAVRGLPQQVIVLRDQAARASSNEGPANCGNGVPFRDVTVNNVPVNSYLAPMGQVAFVPASLTARPNQKQFWRVANTAADTILDLSLVYDGVPQQLGIAAIDGVPVFSQDGNQPGSILWVPRFRLPPASRVEFIVTTPSASVQSAQLMTANIDTGPDGDCDPTRPLINISTFNLAEAPKVELPAAKPLPRGAGRRFAGLRSAPVTAQRTVFFAENNPANEFYMTVEGQPNKVYSPNQAPGIITTKGSVEQWIVENRSRENHEFHIHQIHFLVQSQNFSPEAPGINGQYLDTIEVPAWSGSGPYPSVTLLMDFRGAVVGDFVFHCHILEHEDNGMMNIIRVNPAPTRTTRKRGGG